MRLSVGLLYILSIMADDGFITRFSAPASVATISSEGQPSSVLSKAIKSSEPTIEETEPTGAPLDDPQFPIVHPIQHEPMYDNNGAEMTIATTMITDTDFFGKPITTPSTFILEPSLKAFEQCIFGCSSVTVPCSTETGGSTVIVVLPLTIPCSLVKCPPCSSCISSTVSITVCPVITTITPVPATATIFTTAVSIATERCQAMIVKAVQSVKERAVAEVVTVTRTKLPVGCPGPMFAEDPITRTVNIQSVCSTFVVCQASRFMCPLSSIGELEGSHVIDTLQALLTQSSTTGLLTESSESPRTETIELEPLSATITSAEMLFQVNSASAVRYTFILPVAFVIVFWIAV